MATRHPLPRRTDAAGAGKAALAALASPIAGLGVVAIRIPTVECKGHVKTVQAIGVLPRAFLFLWVGG